MIKKIVVISMLIFSFSGFSQKSLNDYKYVVVSEKFDFVRSKDQYQTSSLTKFLFNKYGYTAFLVSDDLPKAINENRCNGAMYADVVKLSSMFSIKLQVVLKDCKGDIIYTSIEGKSKEKEYKKGYHEALRRVFKDPILKQYKYIAKQKDHETTPIVKKEVSIAAKKIVPAKKITTKPSINNSTSSLNSKRIELLYAQKSKNGLQLVDSTPKIRYQIIATSKEGVYLLVNKKGILFSNGKDWTIEYFDGEKRVKKNYSIKF
jgi:hypothetical protein